MERSVKATGKGGDEFSHLWNQFLKINETKTKNGVSCNPRNRNILDKSINEATLNSSNVTAYSLRLLLISWAVAKQKIGVELLKRYHIGSNMSLRCMFCIQI
jgi:hypothetical protein